VTFDVHVTTATRHCDVNVAQSRLRRVHYGQPSKILCNIKKVNKWSPSKTYICVNARHTEDTKTPTVAIVTLIAVY